MIQKSVRARTQTNISKNLKLLNHFQGQKFGIQFLFIFWFVFHPSSLRWICKPLEINCNERHPCICVLLLFVSVCRCHWKRSYVYALQNALDLLYFCWERFLLAGAVRYDKFVFQICLATMRHIADETQTWSLTKILRIGERIHTWVKYPKQAARYSTTVSQRRSVWHMPYGISQKFGTFPYSVVFGLANAQPVSLLNPASTIIVRHLVSPNGSDSKHLVGWACGHLYNLGKFSLIWRIEFES